MAEMAVRSRGLYPEVGRALRSGNPEWGPGREVTGAGDAGGAKMASLLGQVDMGTTLKEAQSHGFLIGI